MDMEKFRRYALVISLSAALIFIVTAIWGALSCSRHSGHIKPWPAASAKGWDRQAPDGISDFLGMTTCEIISPKRARLEKALMRAKNAYLNGDRAGAREILDGALSSLDEKANAELLEQALFDTGSFFRAQKDNQTAIEYFSRAIDIAGRNGQDKFLKELLAFMEPLYIEQERGENTGSSGPASERIR